MFGLALALAATLSGSVFTGNHVPVGSADVALTGNNLTRHQKTDSSGQFVFSGLNVGTYQVFVETTAGAAREVVDLGSAGARVTLTLLNKVAQVRTTSLPPVRGSGTDVTVNAQYLQRSPAGTTFPSLLLQVPGAARGANGVVHINGDHGDINYVIDGVPVPQELNRNIGTEFDLADVSFVEVLQGAYPAEYGNRFAAVVNVNTKVGNGAPGFEGYARAGSYASADSQFAYHGVLGTGSYVASVNAARSDRFLDPPNPDSPHNNGSNTNQFFRFTQPLGEDYWNLTLSHSYQAFQIPNDVAGGEPADTDDNETQNDSFGAFSFHHVLRGGGATTFALGYKNSTIRDLPDQANDFIYGAYSLYSDRTARDIILNFDNELPSNAHDVRFGGSYDVTSVLKLYRVTLRPPSFLSTQAYTVTDNAPNTGHDEWAYVQDSWKMGQRYELDYGLREDAFQVASTDFEDGFSQVSPRMKFTRFFGSRANIYVYYGRFFTPFSLENVSPEAAHLLNLPLQPTVAQFDLRPQRDSDYEIGGHLPLGAGQLGLRVMQKNATDLIDDTQVGVTALHQDINYAQGSISSQSAYYQQALPSGGRFYTSLTHTRSVNKGCETQLLAPCFGQPDDWTPADHDQNWDATTGVLLNDRRGGWLSLTGEYGSGLSTAAGCDSAILFCKVPPHTTFDVEKGIAIAPGVALTLSVYNLLNDRYLVTFANAQGNHYAAPRVIQAGITFGRP